MTSFKTRVLIRASTTQSSLFTWTRPSLPRQFLHLLLFASSRIRLECSTSPMVQTDSSAWKVRQRSMVQPSLKPPLVASYFLGLDCHVRWTSGLPSTPVFLTCRLTNWRRVKWATHWLLVSLSSTTSCLMAGTCCAWIWPCQWLHVIQLTSRA